MYRLLNHHIAPARRHFLALIGITLVFSRFAATPPHAVQAQDAQRCFDETGYCIAGRIREFWEQNGGLPVFGLPITPQQEEMIEGQPLQVQWFERNRLELHPQNTPPHDVLLGRLGVDALEQQGRSLQNISPSKPQEGCRFFAETEQNVCGDILAAWQANGLERDGLLGISTAESLALFGLPLGTTHTETITNTEGISTTLTVQWFERARFELHPQNVPPFHVQLGLLGSELHATAQPMQPAKSSANGPLAFVSHQDGNADIYVMQPDGTVTNLTNHPANDMHPAWSPDGSRIAFASNRNGHFDIMVMNADGSEPRNLTNYWDTFVAARPSNDLHPAWSPDGTQVVFESNRGGDGEINMMDVQGFEQTNLTNHSGDDGDPAWSPDGTHIAFASNRDGAWDIFLMRTDGSGQRNITSSPDDAGSPSWSPDGAHIVFHALTFRPNRVANFEIYVMDAQSAVQTAVTDNETDDINPAWSPDGTRITFEAHRDSATEIYIMQANGAAPALLSGQPALSSEPVWAADG